MINVTTTTRTGPASKVFMLIWGFLFVGGMGFVTALMLHAAYRDLRPFFWDTAQCKILEAEVLTKHKEFFPRVAYSYEKGGGSYRSDQLSAGLETSLSPTTYRRYSDAKSKLRGVRTGDMLPCYVNPQNAADAALRRKVPWYAAFAVIPLCFAALGLAIIVAAFRGPRTATAAPLTGGVAAPGRRRRAAYFAPLILFGLIAAAGVGFGYAGFLRPYLANQAALKWTPAECKIESSQVDTIPGDNSTTYAPNVLYSFSVNGESYRSSQFSPGNGDESSSYSWAESIASRFSAGKTVPCWYNSSDPDESALDRSAQPPVVLSIVGGVLLLIGLLGFRAFLRRRPAAGSAGDMLSSAGPVSAGVFPAMHREIVFQSKGGRVTNAIVLLFFGLIWNGMVGVFVYQLTQSFSIFLGALLIPFVLIGLAIVWGFVHSLLALANPSVEVRVQSPLVLGQPFSIVWKLEGKTERVEKVQITLEGQEEVRYRRGTTTHHFSKVFQVIEVLNHQGGQFAVFQGTARAQMPALTVPTFSASNNKVLWCFRIKGTIPRWPDIGDEFSVEVAAP